MSDPVKILGAFIQGQDFNGSKLIKLISQGGQGGVILAEQFETKKLVAVKVAFKENNTVLAPRHFVRETEILSELELPRVSKINSTGVYAEKLPYMVLDYIPGISFDKYSDDSRLPVKQRCEMFVTACDIVGELHRRRIIHCDLKPSNFLVTPDGQITLIDFGSAFRFGRVEDGGTGKDNPGTEMYMSPEQIRGEVLDERTDVYSMGVMLYQLVTGYLPFMNKPDVKLAIQSAERQAPSEAIFRTGRINRDGDLYPMNPDEVAASRGMKPQELANLLKAGLDTQILAAIHPDQRHRFQTIAALSDAVSNCVR